MPGRRKDKQLSRRLVKDLVDMPRPAHVAPGIWRVERRSQASSPRPVAFPGRGVSFHAGGIAFHRTARATPAEAIGGPCVCGMSRLLFVTFHGRDRFSPGVWGGETKSIRTSTARAGRDRGPGGPPKIGAITAGGRCNRHFRCPQRKRDVDFRAARASPRQGSLASPAAESARGFEPCGRSPSLAGGAHHRRAPA